MRRRTLNTLTLASILVGCAWPGPPLSDLVVVIANGGPDDASLIAEGRDGGTVAVPVDACSSQSQVMPANRAWHVEVADAPVLTLSDVEILVGVPLTVYHVVVDPDGTVDVAGPEAANRMPDAPVRFPCVAP